MMRILAIGLFAGLGLYAYQSGGLPQVSSGSSPSSAAIGGYLGIGKGVVSSVAGN